MEWKMSFRKNLIVLVTFIMTLGASVAFAEDGGASHGDIYASLASALAIGIAVLGGSLGQAKTATAALEAIGRNPAAQGKIFVPMIIGLALIESLVLYAFVIALVKIKG
jgi:F-type H+-transporting ATPase subunit c